MADDSWDISKFSQRGQNEQRAMSFSKVADILRCMMPKQTDYIIKVEDGRERGREALLRIRREADDKDWEGFPSGIGKGHILQDIKIAFDLQVIELVALSLGFDRPQGKLISSENQCYT